VSERNVDDGHESDLGNDQMRREWSVIGRFRFTLMLTIVFGIHGRRKRRLAGMGQSPHWVLKFHVLLLTFQ